AEDANAELARRERVRHRREAPPWPISVSDRRSDVDAVKARVDLVRLVEKYSLTPLRPAGKRMLGHCPFLDHEDRSPSFNVDPKTQRYRCWGCGRRGDALAFVREFLGVERFGTGLDFLMAEAGMALSERVARVG
ncbi:MAG: CHC2 zinc finger domain-containing protein, partial [Chloroflexota bacterium]|nr:CHC2 zinc finger domain-containing protein [Chloroflexota bacterium]